MLNEGDMAPDVMVQSMDGVMVRLRETVAVPMVVYFYPKDDTPGCTTEAKDFSVLAPAFAEAGVAIVGISKDSSKRHQNFSTKHALAFPLVTDVDGSVCEAFGAWVEKSLYGRKYMGIDRSTFLIAADGSLAGIWRKVKVKGHAEAVLAAARALT
jgi:peroxiredoxin Q/BCP